MLWPMWVIPIAGSTGSAHALFALPTFTSRRMPGVDLRSSRERGRFLVAFTLGRDRPGHPCDLVGECDGRDLRWPPRQQSGEPRPMLGAMDFGIANDGERARREQVAQIAITASAC